jgi:hypothetical protein
MKCLSLLCLSVACTPAAVKIGAMPGWAVEDETVSSTDDDSSGSDDDSWGPPPDGSDDSDDSEPPGDSQVPDDSDEPPVDGSLPKWTVMVYLAGDNNLEQWALKDLNEMEIAGSTDEVNIIVEIDRAFGYDDSDRDWTGARRYHIQQDDNMNSIDSPVVADLGEVDSGAAETYVDFINWTVDNFPAQQYALVIWNHGWGWTLAPESGRKGVSSDDESGNDISIANGEYEEILIAAKEATGDRLTLVGMDACLMANWEIARLTADYADVYVASQATESIEGWAFNTALTDLVEDPEMEADELGTAFAQRFYETGDSTLSVIDLAQLVELDGAIDLLADAVLSKDNPRGAVREQAQRAQKFDGDRNDKDFRDFLRHMIADSADEDLVEASENLDDQLNETILANFSNGDFNNATGLSLYIPTRGYDSTYELGRWNELTRWDEVVDTLR